MMPANSIPYSFDIFYQIHARYPHPSLFALRDKAYYRAFDTATGMSLVKVTSADGDLIVRPLVGELPLEDIKHILATDSDLTAFYQYARQNEGLWAVVAPLEGLPLYRSESLYEALIYVIIEQHISWKNAQKAQRVLVEWGNHFVEYDGTKHYTIPPASQLASATIDDLKPLKITFKRMQLLIDLAGQFSANPNFLGTYSSPEELYQQLLAIKGIGHWTASVVVSRALGIYPYIPHNDVALQAAVAKYFDTEKSADATKAVFEQFGEYAGLAAHFTLMKRVLDEYPVMSV